MTEPKPTPNRSKSERKRAALEAQALGERLIGLADEQLVEFSLDERLLDALADARRMKSHGALRRQKQYIGKLMLDVDTAPIVAWFDRLDAADRREKRRFSEAERWRDRLVREGRGALDAFATAVGSEQPELAGLLVELDRAGSDRVEKTVRRQIFRIVHEALAARATNGRIPR